ncbi:MAG: ACT domain-containing protein [Selenomonadales bacterium]|nr:ACT domain-containing protein [Selenomonadales bacterium]
MKIVVTVVGKDRVGIIAKVTGILAEHSVNVLNLNQNILDGFFNMILIANMEESKVSLREVQELLREEGKKIGVEIKAQNEEIFNAMHTI